MFFKSTSNSFVLLTLLSANLICLAPSFLVSVKAEQMSLTSIMPKLEAIYEDASSLLLKNGELKNQILAGLQVQNEAKLKLVRDKQLLKPIVKPAATPGGDVEPIDFVELEDFNKWVDANLEYAVKNTLASIEALKEEAAQNNGMIDYTDQAIKDGIEGVKYWQQAVIFQDKTLKREAFETTEHQ